MNLKPETEAEIDQLIARYPQKKSAMLMVLHLVQDEQGYISDEAMEWVALKLEVAPIAVLEVVTFYPMYRRQPIGRRHVKVCRTLPCALSGFAPVVQVDDRLYENIKPEKAADFAASLKAETEGGADTGGDPEDRESPRFNG